MDVKRAIELELEAAIHAVTDKHEAERRRCWFARAERQRIRDIEWAESRYKTACRLISDALLAAVEGK